MATYLGASVGRLRVTSAVVYPSEPGFMHAMKKQADALASDLNGYIERFKGVSAEAIKFSVKPIMDRSQELVPVDTGELKASAFMATETMAKGTRVLIGYARYGQPYYAIYVHERLDLRHAQGKSAKFLERAISEKLHVFKSNLMAYYRKEMGLNNG